MSLSYRQENAKTLAALLGIEEEEAAQRLSLRIAVTFDSKTEAIRELGSTHYRNARAAPSSMPGRQTRSPLQSKS